MKRLAALLLAVAAPAQADTLVDNVQGLTLDAQGRVQRFSALLIDDNGRVEQLYQRTDKRPARVDYRLDGKGQVLMPGLIDSHADLMAFGLSLLGPATPDARPRPDDRDAALQKAQQFLLERGVTTVTDMGTTIEAWQTYRRAGDLGRLSLRIAAYAESVEDMVLIGGPGPTPWLYDDRLRLNGLHIPDTRPPPPQPVASLRPLQPAALAAQAARERQGSIQLKNLLSRAAIDSFQGAIELRDAKAVGALLDALAELGLTYKGERRWRIELTAMPESAELLRIAQAGITLSLRQQAAPSAPGAHFGANVRYALGSGAPAQWPEPFAAIAAASPREDAFAGYTTGAALAAMAEGRLGRIAVGQHADFLLVDRDPLLAAPDELRAIRVLQTWVGGRAVWQAKASAPATLGPPATMQDRIKPESTESGGR